MKILITSDTHGHYAPISDYILRHDDIDLLIHAGDGIDDVKSIAFETGIKTYIAKGNNDYFSKEAYDKFLDVEGFKIFLTHGHTHNIYGGVDEIVKIAKDNACDMAVFGHTHTFYNEEIDNLILLNPGSVSLPRDGNPGFMIYEIRAGEIKKCQRISV